MKRRSGVLWPVLVAAVAGFCFIAGVVAFNFIMAYSVKRGEEITVPRLVGLSLSKAERVAGQADLEVRKVGERFSATVPPGFVLEQNPPAARSVKSGRNISVIVSGGKENVEVPDLAGQPVRHAIVMLDGAGLEAGQMAESNSVQVENGSVIACDPPPGTILERGSRVDILVSLGPQPLRFAMPDLVGQDADRVRRYLQELGTEVFRSKRFDPRGRVGPYVVVEHRPSHGYMVTEGDTVNLVIGVR
jgi:beta-lactam-binding protein with PASTA domain